jgi:hypothetical protein
MSPDPLTPASAPFEGTRQQSEASDDFQPDATVVAQVPDALLKAASTPEGTPPEMLPAHPGIRDSSPEKPSPSPFSVPDVPTAQYISTPGTPSTPLDTIGLQPDSTGGSEEAEFKEVFDQFLDTKKQCGESIAGITYDRFAEKLQKNIRDLKSRYKCKSVKFQVYVKNGKAALKATPIK